MKLMKLEHELQSPTKALARLLPFAVTVREINNQLAPVSLNSMLFVVMNSSLLVSNIVGRGEGGSLFQ